MIKLPKLNALPVLHYSISRILHKLLNEKHSLNSIMNDMGECLIEEITANEVVFSVDIVLGNDIEYLNSIEKMMRPTNKFMLLIESKRVYKKKLLSMDFLNHNMQFVIDEFLMKQENQTHSFLVSYFDTLEFKSKRIDPFKHKQFALEELSFATLEQATYLRDRIFKDLDQAEKDTLVASLDEDNYKNCYKKNDLASLKYWVIIDKELDTVIGLSGLYLENNVPDTCSLGWFCIDDKYRGRGLGNALLQFSIVQAKLLSKQFLTLYTYNSKQYHSAINLYKKYGFVEDQVTKKKYKNDLHFMLSLQK